MIEDLKPNRGTAIILHKLRKGGRLPDNAVMASLLGYGTTAMIEQWFKGVSRPSLQQLRKIAKIADIAPLTLLPCWLTDADPGGRWEYQGLEQAIVGGNRRTIETLRISLTDEDVPDNPQV